MPTADPPSLLNAITWYPQSSSTCPYTSWRAKWLLDPIYIPKSCCYCRSLSCFCSELPECSAYNVLWNCPSQSCLSPCLSFLMAFPVLIVCLLHAVACLIASAPLSVLLWFNRISARMCGVEAICCIQRYLTWLKTFLFRSYDPSRIERLLCHVLRLWLSFPSHFFFLVIHTATGILGFKGRLHCCDKLGWLAHLRWSEKK